MTLKDSLTLRHNKYIAYSQIWAGFCLAVYASVYFNWFEIRTSFFQTVIIDNFFLAMMFALLGLIYFRPKLSRIEQRLAPHSTS